MRLLALGIENMAADLGEPVQRLGPARINIVRMVMGGGGYNLHLLVEHVLIGGQRQGGDVQRSIPRIHIIRDVWFAITGEGKLAGVEAIGAFVDHAADRSEIVRRLDPVKDNRGHRQLSNYRFRAGFEVNRSCETAFRHCVGVEHGFEGARPGSDLGANLEVSGGGWHGPIVLDLCHRLCRRSKIGIIAGLCRARGADQRNIQQQSKDLHFHDNLPFRRYPGEEVHP
jgi:hypothetical protein